jgi:hypothetical protein
VGDLIRKTFLNRGSQFTSLADGESKVSSFPEIVAERKNPMAVSKVI